MRMSICNICTKKYEIERLWQSKSRKCAVHKMGLNIAINVVFLMAFVIHVFLVAFSLIYPNTPSVKVYKKSFNEIEFPISIKICATEDRDSDAMRHNVTGYKRSFKFFMGESMFNDSLFGWRGHTKDGSVLGSTQGISSLY